MDLMSLFGFFSNLWKWTKAHMDSPRALLRMCSVCWIAVKSNTLNQTEMFWLISAMHFGGISAASDRRPYKVVFIKSGFTILSAFKSETCACLTNTALDSCVSDLRNRILSRVSWVTVMTAQLGMWFVKYWICSDCCLEGWLYRPLPHPVYPTFFMSKWVITGLSSEPGQTLSALIHQPTQSPDWVVGRWQDWEARNGVYFAFCWEFSGELYPG